MYVEVKKGTTGGYTLLLFYRGLHTRLIHLYLSNTTKPLLMERKDEDRRHQGLPPLQGRLRREYNTHEFGVMDLRTRNIHKSFVDEGLSPIYRGSTRVSGTGRGKETGGPLGLRYPSRTANKRTFGTDYPNLLILEPRISRFTNEPYNLRHDPVPRNLLLTLWSQGSRGGGDGWRRVRVFLRRVSVEGVPLT